MKNYSIINKKCYNNYFPRKKFHVIVWLECKKSPCGDNCEFIVHVALASYPRTARVDDTVWYLRELGHIVLSTESYGTRGQAEEAIENWCALENSINVMCHDYTSSAVVTLHKVKLNGKPAIRATLENGEMFVTSNTVYTLEDMAKNLSLNHTISLFYQDDLGWSRVGPEDVIVVKKAKPYIFCMSE